MKVEEAAGSVIMRFFILCTRPTPMIFTNASKGRDELKKQGCCME